MAIKKVIVSEKDEKAMSFKEFKKIILKWKNWF